MTAIRKRFLLSEEERVGRRKLKRSTGVSKKGIPERAAFTAERGRFHTLSKTGRFVRECWTIYSSALHPIRGITQGSAHRLKPVPAQNLLAVLWMGISATEPPL
jgi:hypothetical protein